MLVASPIYTFNYTYINFALKYLHMIRWKHEKCVTQYPGGARVGEVGKVPTKTLKRSDPWRCTGALEQLEHSAPVEDPWSCTGCCSLCADYNLISRRPTPTYKSKPAVNRRWKWRPCRRRCETVCCVFFVFIFCLLAIWGVTLAQNFSKGPILKNCQKKQSLIPSVRRTPTKQLTINWPDAKICLIE